MSVCSTVARLSLQSLDAMGIRWGIPGMLCKEKAVWAQTKLHTSAILVSLNQQIASLLSHKLSTLLWEETKRCKQHLARTLINEEQRN